MEASNKYLCKMHVRFLYCLVLVCSYVIVQTSSTVCDPNFNFSLRDKVINSESTVRGKIVDFEDSQTFIVKVINVYKGDNATEGQHIKVTVLSNSELTDNSTVCMNSAEVRAKYILFLRRQSSPSNNGYYLEYDGVSSSREVARSVRQITDELAAECDDWAFTTMSLETQSDAAHYAPCSEFLEKHFCQNNGKCVHIVALAQDSCVCPDGYGGSRCEGYRYILGNEEGFDSTPYIILGCMAAFILLLCALVAYLYVRNRRKSLHEQNGSGRDTEEALSLKEGTLSADSNQNTTLHQGNTEQEEKHSTKYNKIPSDELAISDETIKSTNGHRTSLPASEGSLHSKNSIV